MAEVKKKNPLNVVLSVAIILLLVVVVYLVVVGKNPFEGPRAVTTIVGSGNNTLDAHGCYTPIGLSWCAAKDKCIKLAEEDCAKQDVSQQMCLQSEAAAQAQNITNIIYNYDVITGVCSMTEAGYTEAFKIDCENDQLKANLEIRSAQMNLTQIESGFPGCIVSEV